MFNSKQFFYSVLGLFSLYSCQLASAQTASLSNSAAPSASSVTTGGTNVNYQTNNQWSNEVGFGPGIFCRTPTFYVGGSVGTTNNSQISETFADTGNYGQNISGNVGVLVPFGSSSLRDCNRFASQIVRDRQISTELSMIRACRSLKNEGIVVDPQKYPLLALCVDDPSPVPTKVSDVQANPGTSKGTSVSSPSTPASKKSAVQPPRRGVPEPNGLHSTTTKSTVRPSN